MKSHVHPHIIHTFPTRRSSDLSRSDLGDRDLWRVGHALAPSGTHARSAVAAAQSCVPDGASADRKSTRLNSSHVSISYAVFCLKKKNVKVVYSYLRSGIELFRS